jgi:hypothetical protein
MEKEGGRWLIVDWIFFSIQERTFQHMADMRRWRQG